MAAELVPAVTFALAALTAVGDLFLIISGLTWLYKGLTHDHEAFAGISGFFRRHALLFSFIVALIATSGSLFYSEIAGYTPCVLCWYQRIFMYPLVLVLGAALIGKKRGVVRYDAPLAAAGGLIALYHYSLQRFPLLLSAPCEAGASCARVYTFTFGYVTIPMMALTAFLLILAGMHLWKKTSS